MPSRSAILSRRAFGGGYLVGTGVTLGAILVLRLLRFDGGDAVVRFATVTGAVAAISLVVVGCWVSRGVLSDQQVWNLCQAGGLGIGAITLAGVAVGMGEAGTATGRLTADVLVSNAAVGGLAGVSIAGARDFHKKSQQVARLEQRNAVLCRILRHNVRNDINVILGTVEDMKPTARSRQNHWLDRIEGRANRLHGVSESARRVAGFLDGHERPMYPVDLVPVVERTVHAVTETAENVSIETTLPPQAIVRADGLLPVVVENLVENAAVHPEEATVSITVETVTVDGSQRVRLEVRDDGPGIPEHEIEAIEDGEETQLTHGSGLGLWLVTWLLDRYGGEVTVDTTDGTVVTVSFRPGESPTSR